MPASPNPLKTEPEFTPPNHHLFVVGDLFQTVMRLSRYELGPIAKINNYLAGSHYSALEETIRETETIDRTEMERQSEIESFSSASSQELMRDTARQIQNKTQKVDIGAEASGSYGMVEFSAYGDYSNSNSRQKSREQAKETSNRVVNESREKTTSRILSSNSRRELLVQTSKLEAGVDNRLGGHVAGITLGVNEVHKVDLLNHSKHLFSNVIIANPWAHYQSWLDHQGQSPAQPLSPAPRKLTYEGAELHATDINKDNWLELATHFNLDEALPPPEPIISVTGNIDMQSPSRPTAGHDAILTSLTVPEGYVPHSLYVANSGVVHDGNKATARVYAGGHWKNIGLAGESKIDLQPLIGTNRLHALAGGQGGKLDVGLTASGHYDSGATFDLHCTLSNVMYELWQFDFYSALMTSVSGIVGDSPTSLIEDLGVGSVDFTTNPTLAKKFIQQQFKQAISSQIFGSDFEGFEVMDSVPTFPKYPEIDLIKLGELTPLIKFLDTVFDYDKMTVRYVDNHIGDESNRKRVFEGQRPGPLKDFLESTFAQVIIPIARFGQNEARFMWKIQTGDLFKGDDVPLIDSSLSLSILEELEEAEDLQNLGPEIVDTWEISVVSPHTILQSDAVLPNYDDPSLSPKAVTETQPTPAPNSA